jgi:hypothetical protein
VEFNGKLWLIAGNNNGTRVNDIWSSSDCINWTLENPNAGFPVRNAHTTVVYNGKILIIGGCTADNSASFLSDVWSSSNGVNWIQVTNTTAFGERRQHMSAIYENKIWVIGGIDQNYTLKNDVWTSTDGANWVEATSSAGFASRTDAVCLVYKGKMWIIGGLTYTDAWCSNDGINWTMTDSAIGMSGANASVGLVYDNKMWIISGSYTQEVWWSQ